MLKSILSAFVEIKDDEKPLDPNKPIKPQVEGKTNIPNFQSSVPIPTVHSATASNVAMLDEMTARFNQILADANKDKFPGDDFYEFSTAKDSLKSAIPLEPVLYASAYSVIAARPGLTKLTKEKLLSTGEQYKAIIDDDLKGFEESFKQVFDREVEGRKKLLAQKQKEIADLSAKIVELDNESKVLHGEIMHSENELIAKRNHFNLAATQFKATLQTELDKIRQYIQ